MDNTHTLQINIPVEAEEEATFAAYMTEIERLQEMMRQDQVEIDNLKAESQALKAETQEIKARIRALQGETLLALDRLEVTPRPC